MNKITTNICIVGAGPGGAIAALTLAKHHIPCILIDKAQFPRHKADSDALTPNVFRELYELDPTLPDKLFARYPDKTSILHYSTYYSPKGYTLDIPIGSDANKERDLVAFASCRRLDFDNFLLGLAHDSPYIQVLENTNITESERDIAYDIVRLKTRDAALTIECRLAIIATGANSVLSQKLGNLPFNAKEQGVGMRFYFKDVVGLKTDRASLIVDKRLMPGGICLVPMSDNTICVSVFIRSYEVIKKKINLQALTLDVLATNPSLINYFKNATMIGKPIGSSLHLGIKDRIIAGDNYLLVGDSAGLADPITANGVGHAMISGRMAAQKAIECVTANDYSKQMTADYSPKIAKRLEASLKRSRLSYHCFQFPNLASTAADWCVLLSKHPFFLTIFLASNIKAVLLKKSTWRILFGFKPKLN